MTIINENEKEIIMGDVICPNCGSEDCYSYNTDDEEFSCDGTGYTNVDYQCRGCNTYFRAYYEFKFEITSLSYGKYKKVVK